MIAVPICFWLERQTACRAFSRAWAKTGKRIAARMAMIAITTSSSISVKPRPRAPWCSIALSPYPGDLCVCLVPSVLFADAVEQLRMVLHVLLLVPLRVAVHEHEVVSPLMAVGKLRPEPGALL